MLSAVTEPLAREETVHALARWTRVDLVAVVLIMVLAGALRIFGLSHPDELVFDETYYAKDACWYVQASEEQCQRAADAPEVHPPLGKWMIGIGIRLFGFDCPTDRDPCTGTSTSFAWRIIPAIAGTLSVGLLYLLARRLFMSTLAAIAAALLLTFDLLHFVQSRTSMLDIFLPLFGIAAFLFLVLDRDRERPPDVREGILSRPWLLAAGAAFGAAVATKWSGALMLVAGIVLTLVWEFASRSGEPLRARVGAVLRRGVPAVLVFLLIVPFLLYSLTYAGRVVNGHLTGAPWKEGHAVRILWDHHRYMADFHDDLTSVHSYQSPPWSWLALKRPVSYYFCSGDSCTPPNDGEYEETFATGSPFVWWTSVLALLYVAYRWIRRRNWRGPEGVILAGFAFTYLPWLVLASDRPAVFLFYMLPSVPFMCLALAYVITKIGRSWEAKAAIALFSLGAIGMFFFYYPLLVGKPIPQEDWKARIWVFDNCDKPTGGPATVTQTETVGKEVRTYVTETTSDTSGQPPTGWCWI